MSFDEEVDAARRKLEAALVEDRDNAIFDELAALEELIPILKDRIQTRRLEFALGEDEGESVIEIVHASTEEALGFVYVQDQEYIFESNLDAYFDDFVDEDAQSFVQRLYETLRADLPKYEVENV
jgi:hypothetical protein